MDRGVKMNANFKINGKQIETDRLILRAFRQSDLDDFYEYASVEVVGEMAGWKHHESKEESQKILDMFIDNDEVFAICFKETNKVIGSLGVEAYGEEKALAELYDYKGREIGYVLSKDYWGRGIMPEAVKAVMDYLFNDLNLDFLICGYYDFNGQSKRVQEKCGFKPYRRLELKTQRGTKERSVLNFILNPHKNISLAVTYSNTLIEEEN